jgi:hypothetical protein
MEPRNWFQRINSANLCSLADRYDNPIPTRFLAPTDCLKVPALFMTGTSPIVNCRVFLHKRENIIFIYHILTDRQRWCLLYMTVTPPAVKTLCTKQNDVFAYHILTDRREWRILYKTGTFPPVNTLCIKRDRHIYISYFYWQAIMMYSVYDRYIPCSQNTVHIARNRRMKTEKISCSNWPAKLVYSVWNIFISVNQYMQAFLCM